MPNKFQISNFKFQKVFLVLSIVALLAAGCNKTPQPVAQEVQGEQSIQVRQKVEGDMGDSLFNIYPSENKTALDLLKMGHVVEGKDLGGGNGMHVNSINGQKETKGKTFWAFYVNGKRSTIAAGVYIPKDKDFLEWKLDETF
jgi:hypothetical protein